MAPDLARFESEQPNVEYQDINVDERDSAEFKRYSRYFEGHGIPFTVLIDSSGDARKEWSGPARYEQLMSDVQGI